MFSVCLVVPTWHHLSDPFLHQPYWELYFATILRDRFLDDNVSIEVIDLRGVSSEDRPMRIKQIPKHDLFIYWIFKSTDSIEQYSNAKKLKEIYPKSTHVGGGTHVEMQPEECSINFDAIVVGPGEELLIKIIEDIRNGNLKKIYYQDWKEVSFSDTPFPRRDFLPRDHVINKNLFTEYGGGFGTIVYFSRGCIYNCCFCTLNVPNFLQVRSPETIKAEIRYLKKDYNVDGVVLKEEVAIHPNPKISTKVLNAIRESHIKWRGQTTTNATYEQLKLARESGCQELAIGIETVDPQVMKIINKSWQNEKKIQDFIANAKKLGIKIKTCFILGLPGEPMNIVERTIKFIEDNEIDYANVSGFCPIPGSPIYNNAEYYGIKSIDKDWNKHAHLLYRFSDEENVGLPFEYEEENRWGKTFTRKQIAENIRQLQRWLRSRKLSY